MGPETKGAPPLRISGQKMYGQEPSGMMLETVPRIALGRYLAYSAPSEYAASMGEGDARSGGPLREDRPRALLGLLDSIGKVTPPYRGPTLCTVAEDERTGGRGRGGSRRTVPRPLQSTPASAHGLASHRGPA